MNKQDVINLLEKINPDAARKLSDIEEIWYIVTDIPSVWLENAFDWGREFCLLG